MDKFVVRGGNPLLGTIKVSGAKNSALPCMAAAILTEDEVILENIPQVRDIETERKLLTSMGAEVELGYGRAQHRTRIKVARIFNTYGPRMHPNDGRVVWLHATARGGRLLHAGRRRRVAALEADLAALAPAERDTLAAAAGILERVLGDSNQAAESGGTDKTRVTTRLGGAGGTGRKPRKEMVR